MGSVGNVNKSPFQDMENHKDPHMGRKKDPHMGRKMDVSQPNSQENHPTNSKIVSEKHPFKASFVLVLEAKRGIIKNESRPLAVWDANHGIIDKDFKPLKGIQGIQMQDGHIASVGTNPGLPKVKIRLYLDKEWSKLPHFADIKADKLLRILECVIGEWGAMSDLASSNVHSGARSTIEEILSALGYTDWQNEIFQTSTGSTMDINSLLSFLAWELMICKADILFFPPQLEEDIGCFAETTGNMEPKPNLDRVEERNSIPDIDADEESTYPDLEFDCDDDSFVQEIFEIDASLATLQAELDHADSFAALLLDFEPRDLISTDDSLELQSFDEKILVKQQAKEFVKLADCKNTSPFAVSTLQEPKCFVNQDESKEIRTYDGILEHIEDEGDPTIPRIWRNKAQEKPLLSMEVNSQMPLRDSNALDPGTSNLDGKKSQDCKGSKLKAIVKWKNGESMLQSLSKGTLLKHYMEVVAPRKGHIECDKGILSLHSEMEGDCKHVRRIFAFLSKRKHATARFQLEETNLLITSSPEHCLARNTHQEIKEVLTQDILEPLEKFTTITSYVIANLLLAVTMGRIVMGSLELVSKNSVDQHPKKQHSLKIDMYGSDFLSSKTNVDQLILPHSNLRYLKVPVHEKSYMFSDHEKKERSYLFGNQRKKNLVDILNKHWGYQKIRKMLKPLTFWELSSDTLEYKKVGKKKSVGIYLLKKIQPEKRGVTKYTLVCTLCEYFWMFSLVYLELNMFGVNQVIHFGSLEVVKLVKFMLKVLEV